MVRRAQPGYVAAPASLLALAARRLRDGALVNVAFESTFIQSPDHR
jgi:hypothetical protein